MSRVIENPKQLILEKSKEILISDGYTKLSMRNVAKACNIALGTIYNYYPTKKDLVMAMMEGYWEEYFILLDKIVNSENDFYVKLNDIFINLDHFTKKFKKMWLRPEFYATPDFVETGVEREYVYFEGLIRRLETLLINEASKKDSVITLKLDSYDTAKFITMNFMTMIQMPFFHYSTFEQFLKELLN